MEVSKMYKDLRAVKDEYTPTILQGLYDNAFTGLTPEYGWDVIRVLHNADCLLSLNDIDIDMDARMDFVADKVNDTVSMFYDNNQALLNDDFTLNDYYYNVNLRAFIIEVERTLKSDKKYNYEE
jgi:hypothetical protein